MQRPAVILAVVLCFSGCMYGPSVKTFEPVQRPEGIRATVKLRGGLVLAGELMAMKEDGLIVRTDEEIVFVTFERISSGTFAQKRSLRIGAGRSPHPGKHEQLRLLSRFPQGLDGEVLERLLAAHGQNELVVFR